MKHLYSLRPVPTWLYQINKVFPKNQVKLFLDYDEGMHYGYPNAPTEIGSRFFFSRF